MACVAGKNGVLKADGSAIAQLTSYTITENADTTECSHFDTGGWREFRTTMRGFDGSADFVWDRQDGDLITGTEYALEVYPEGEGAGQWKINGSVIITSIEISGETEGFVSGSISFQGTGALTRAEAV